MTADNYREWALRFQADAESDGFRKVIEQSPSSLVGDHNQDGHVSKARARRMIRDTIECAAFVIAYMNMDGQPQRAEAFLHKQTYEIRESTRRYLLVFELGRFRRVQFLVDKLDDLDLTDLYNAIGYGYLAIRHPDQSSFKRGEHSQLESAIRYDFNYDADGDDIELYFDRFDEMLVFYPREPEEVSGEAMTPGQKAAATRKKRAAGAKAAQTRKRRAAGKKAARTRKRRAAGQKAALTRKRRAAGRKAADTRKRNATAKQLQSAIQTSEGTTVPMQMPSA